MQKRPTLEIPREGRAANVKYPLLGAQGQEGPARPAGFRDWEVAGGAAMPVWLEGPAPQCSSLTVPKSVGLSQVYSGSLWRCQTLEQTPGPGTGVEEGGPGPCLPSLLTSPASPQPCAHPEFLCEDRKLAGSRVKEPGGLGSNPAAAGPGPVASADYLHSPDLRPPVESGDNKPTS